MTVRVLLVDDVADVRRLVRIALRFHGGFEVVGEAGAGLQAIELATQLRPDIVLLDLGLPDLAGRDVLTQVREVVPEAKVVVFTGADEDRAYYEEHAAGYVIKSADLDYLVALLDDVGRTAQRSESVRFDADVSTVPLAREFVRRWLHECGVDHVFDEASLIVTELATNAVLHADSPYEVRLSRADGVVRIEVADDDAGTPEPQPFSAVAESGRGIVIVSAISASWGIDAQPQRQGHLGRAAAGVSRPTSGGIGPDQPVPHVMPWCARRSRPRRTHDWGVTSGAESRTGDGGRQAVQPVDRTDLLVLRRRISAQPHGDTSAGGRAEGRGLRLPPAVDRRGGRGRAGCWPRTWTPVANRRTGCPGDPAAAHQS